MATHWYCGNCKYGPMLVETVEHCVLCHHQRDSTATYEDWGVSFTASLNQPDPSSSEIHCGNRGLISYQSTLELEVGGLPVQETASASSKCSSGQSGDGPKYINAEMKHLSSDFKI